MGVMDFLSGIPFVGDIISGGMDLIAGDRERKMLNTQFDTNIALQREFAQHGIRWKAADAKAAGLHPLAALGANTMSFQPQSLFRDGSGSALRNMGQGMAQTIYNYKMRKEQVRNVELQNDLLEKQIENMGQGIVGGNVTAFNYGSSGDGTVRTVPDEQTLGRSGIDSGVHNLESLLIDKQNRVWLLPSKKAEEAMEQAITDSIDYNIQKGYRKLESWVNFLRAYAHNTTYLIKFAEKLRRERREISKDNPQYRPGYSFKWSLKHGRWIYAPHTGRFFYETFGKLRTIPY